MRLPTIRILLSLVFIAFPATIHAQNVSRTECFAFEKLPTDQRRKAEELLLKALDGEALYTIVGGLKPMSSGVQSFQLKVQLPRVEIAKEQLRSLESKPAEQLSPDERRLLDRGKEAIERKKMLDKIDEARAILRHWRCGDELFADVQHFSRTYEGRRFLEVVVFSRSRLQQLLFEKSDFFSRWGVTPNSHPLEVLYAVDGDETGARFGGYGYLFGYPEYAVRFFVQASDEEEFSGKFVDRDFYSIPTFERATNSFVYAVPKNHRESEIDRSLRAKAERILTTFKRRRGEYIGEGKSGVVEMVRDWLCPKSAERCSPQNAVID